MFKLIDFDDKIFTSQQFKKDEISFNIILTLIQKREYFPQIKCYSDQKDVIILNTDANHPVVVWTSENFNDFELIYNFVSKVFSKNEPFGRVKTLPYGIIFGGLSNERLRNQDHG